MALAFIVTAPSDQIFWAALACELTEPFGYYVLASYMAFRRVSTVTHLTTMIFSLPFYYSFLFLLVILRRDISKSRTLAKVIYFPYASYSLPRQLLVHLFCQSLPYSLVVLSRLIFDGFNAVAVAAIVVSGVAGLVYAVEVCRLSQTTWSPMEVLPTENTGEDDLDTL